MKLQGEIRVSGRKIAVAAHEAPEGSPWGGRAWAPETGMLLRWVDRP